MNFIIWVSFSGSWEWKLKHTFPWQIERVGPQKQVNRWAPHLHLFRPPQLGSTHSSGAQSCMPQAHQFQPMDGRVLMTLRNKQNKKQGRHIEKLYLDMISQISMYLAGQFGAIHERRGPSHPVLDLCFIPICIFFVDLKSFRYCK